jgi:TIR domain
MIILSAQCTASGLTWHHRHSPDEDITIDFIFTGKLAKRAALQQVQKCMADGELPWLSVQRNKWSVDAPGFYAAFGKVNLSKPVRGKVVVDPEVDEDGQGGTSVAFTFSTSDWQLCQGARIFLSHKGEDKKMVRRFQRALEVIGFEVWLDEKNLKAGDHLERGILQGFEESCAAVFFITERFKDERYLKTEIDYAINETRKKERYFRIITLAFKRGKENPEVPELLKNYVWKSPISELDALTEIIKALPICPGGLELK